MKALVGTFNQEKALVGAFSVIVKTGCGTDGSICGTIVPMWSWCLKTETTNITIGYDGLLRINTCSGILSGHDIFLSAYWLGWAGWAELGWWDADFAIFIQ